MSKPTQFRRESAFRLLAVDARPPVANVRNHSGHYCQTHFGNQGQRNAEDAADSAEDINTVPLCKVHQYGRRCMGNGFSCGGPHSCRVYDKTKEITMSRNDCMQAVWLHNGWDGTSLITCVEFGSE
jgi:hypothetical protein